MERLASTCTLWERKTPLGKVAHLRRLSKFYDNCMPSSLPLLLATDMSPASTAGKGTFKRYLGKTCRVCYTNEASLNWNGEDRPVLIYQKGHLLKVVHCFVRAVIWCRAVTLRRKRPAVGLDYRPDAGLFQLIMNLKFVWEI